MIKHYINLTNGIEFIPGLNELGIKYSFIRLQSTACEQHNWDWFFSNLDNDFLMNVAIGTHCLIYDCSNKEKPPRAIRQGVELIKYVLNSVWLNKEYVPVDKSMQVYFEHVLKNLNRSVKSKLKYYKKFLLTDEIRIYDDTKQTTHDGDYAFYKDIIKKIYRKGVKINEKTNYSNSSNCYNNFWSNTNSSYK